MSLFKFPLRFLNIKKCKMFIKGFHPGGIKKKMYYHYSGPTIFLKLTSNKTWNKVLTVYTGNFRPTTILVGHFLNPTQVYWLILCILLILYHGTPRKNLQQPGI